MMRLTKREKRFAAALTVFVLAWLFFAFVIEPARDRIATLKRVIPQKQADLDKLSAAAREYALLKERGQDLSSRLASRSKTFELLPFLESLVQQVGLEKNLAKMAQRLVPLGTDYSQTVVEIELRGLSLAHLVDFLQRIESSDILARTASLYIKKCTTKKDLLDAVIEVHDPGLPNMKVARQ